MQKLGRYEILSELGRGAMGAVFLAHDPVIDRTVAIKTILASGLAPADHEAYRKRFFREAQAAGKLSHPGIVTIHDVGEEEQTQTPYIVMEFIDGKTLQQVADEAQGILPVDKTLELLKQVAEALNYAHAQGIVHRDIKPANILVTSEGRAKVTDFGVARLRTTQMTVAGELLGTPSFMSPEQFEGTRTDGRSDLFSLGIILYWMLTGQTPFAGEDLSEVMFRVVYKDPTPPTQLNPHLRSEFDHALRRALAKDPTNRYQSGKELAENLQDLLEGRMPRSTGSEPDRPLVEKTIAVSPRERERASDSPVPSDRRISSEAASPSGASTPGPVVTVDWQRVRESTQRISRKALVVGGVFAKKAGVIGALLWRHTVAFAKTLPERSRKAAELARGGWKWFRSLPRKARLGLAAVPALFVAWFLWSWLAFALAPTTTLSFSVRHDLRSGEFSVWVDGWKVGGGDLQGTESKRFGVFRSVDGSYSSVLRVPVGKRIVRVRVAATDGSYDQTRESEADFVAGQDATLVVNCDSRRGLLVLSLH